MTIKKGPTGLSFSASHRPYIVRVSLIVVVHVAIVEVHVPRVGRVSSKGSRRPVVVRLHTRLSVHFFYRDSVGLRFFAAQKKLTRPTTIVGLRFLAAPKNLTRPTIEPLNAEPFGTTVGIIMPKVIYRPDRF